MIAQCLSYGGYHAVYIPAMASFDEQTAKIKQFDQRIKELAAQEQYQKKVKLGIKPHTALSLIVETGDFSRFAKGNTYAAFPGLAPGEHSSGEKMLGVAVAMPYIYGGM